MSGLGQRATTCYMADGSGRGPAYNFWVRVKTEQAKRGWSDSELSRRTGVSRNTIKGLRARSRQSAETVNSVADALDIPRDEAYRLAGLIPSDDQPAAEPAPESRVISAREAILLDPIYTPSQRRTMIELLDMFEQLNRSQRGG